MYLDLMLPFIIKDLFYLYLASNVVIYITIIEFIIVLVAVSGIVVVERLAKSFVTIWPSHKSTTPSSLTPSMRRPF